MCVCVCVYVRVCACVCVCVCVCVRYQTLILGGRNVMLSLILTDAERMKTYWYDTSLIYTIYLHFTVVESRLMIRERPLWKQVNKIMWSIDKMITLFYSEVE